MEWKPATVLPEGIKIPDNWLHIHYYDALTVLFKVENALRMIVYVALKNDRGKAWIDVELSSDESAKTTIAALAKKRIAQAESYGYLGYQIVCPIMHLTSGELVRLITSDAYWALFKKYFKAKKEVVVLKLEEIGTIRNSLAHFRAVTPDDVEVVKQNANQVLAVVEKTLARILGGGQRVPTNSKDEWYASLGGMVAKNSQISLNQSADGEWLRVTIQFKCPILSVRPTQPVDWANYSIINIDPVAVLHACEGVGEAVTCVLENAPITMTKKVPPNLRKHIEFVFNTAAMTRGHADLSAEMQAVLTSIDDDVALLQKDVRARGLFVYTQNIHMQQGDTGYWTLDEEILRRPQKGDEPPEFWGASDLFTDDIVSDAHRFPWMSTPVSNEVSPFS